MNEYQFYDGYAICGSFTDPDVTSRIRTLVGGPLSLSICDPPYGNIVGDEKAWDRISDNDVIYCRWMISWTKTIEALSAPGSALYVWGGVGRPAEDKKPPFRPFLRYLVEVELQTGYRLSTPITWKKKRAYGIQWGYLFTREECAYLVLGDVKKPKKFTVPLLDSKRGYAGYDENHPAKSEFLRRTNVWTDIVPGDLTDVWEETEILRGKTHINQKPERLMAIPIEIHTEPGEFVLDGFAGSGTTAKAARKLGRRFIVVEQDPVEFDKMVESLK